MRRDTPPIKVLFAGVAKPSAKYMGVVLFITGCKGTKKKGYTQNNFARKCCGCICIVFANLKDSILFRNNKYCVLGKVVVILHSVKIDPFLG